MYWFSSGIVFALAFASCMLVFGLLALATKKETPATEPSARNFANAGVGGTRPAQNGRSTNLPSSNGTTLVPREATKAGAPENSVRLSGPLNLSPLPPQKETPLSATFSQLRSLSSAAQPENNQPAATPTALSSVVEESAFLPPIVEELADVPEERTAQDIAMAVVPDDVVETTSDLPASAEDCAEEGDAIVSAPIVVPVTACEERQPGSSLLEFHGLKQQPFDVTPDPAYLYFSPSHREALASLRLGIEHLRGFMMLVADPGMGKTTLMNKLMEELSDSARVVFLFQTQCGSSELLTFILDELEIDHAGMDVVAMHRALNRALLEDMLRGQRFVLIIDEAQNLQGPVLETVRLLSNFETTHSKLIQIVLVGQPQLADTLMHRGLKQLRQRVAVLSSLRPLNTREVSEYVEHRLRAAGWSGTQLFTPEALAQIAKSSEGVPRSINNLCFNALLTAFLRGKKIVDAEMIQSVGGKLNLAALPRSSEEAAIPAQPLAPADPIPSAQRARALPPEPAAPASGSEPSPSVGANGQTKVKPAVIVPGSVTEMVRSQNWDKKREYRVQVTFERDSFPGLSLADRYYCCSFYVGEEQAAKLYAGKRVRIKIDQD